MYKYVYLHGCLQAITSIGLNVIMSSSSNGWKVILISVVGRPMGVKKTNSSPLFTSTIDSWKQRKSTVFTLIIWILQLPPVIAKLLKP